MVVNPSAGATHVHHTEAPPLLPAWSGSPGGGKGAVSLVAPKLLPVVVATDRFSAMALLKSSLGGTLAAFTEVTPPSKSNQAARPKPKIRWTKPEVAGWTLPVDATNLAERGALGCRGSFSREWSFEFNPLG